MVERLYIISDMEFDSAVDAGSMHAQQPGTPQAPPGLPVSDGFPIHHSQMARNLQPQAHSDQNLENLFEKPRSYLVSGIESLVEKMGSANFSGQSVIDFEKDFENNLKKIMIEKNSNASLIFKTEWDIQKTTGNILWEGLASMNVSIDSYSFKKGRLIKKGSYSIKSQKLPISKWDNSDSFKQKYLGKIAIKVVKKWSDAGIKTFIQSIN